MDDEGTWTRRHYLALIGASGLGGLAGCGGQSDPTRATTSPTPAETVTVTPTDTATATIEETETPEQWDVEPLEQDKLVGAHYFPWYWGEAGYAQYEKQPWTNHSPYTPELGTYDSREPEVVNQHIKWALENGINWFLLKGGHPAGPIMNTINKSFFEAELSDQINYALSHGLDKGPVTDENGQFIVDHPENLTEHKRYLAEYSEFFDDSNYVRIDGRPVMWDFGTPALVGDITGALDELRETTVEDPYLIGNITGFWSPPSITPTNRLTPEEIFEAYDAVHKYGPIPRDGADHIEENYPAYWGAQSEYWRFLSGHHDTGFIPTVMPGQNDQEIDWASRTHHDILDLTEDEFREVCDRALDYVDPELNAVIITAWNEFPEGTTIEPAEEYGHQRLDIVRQEIGQTNVDPIPTDEYHLLELDFNQTVNPGSGSGGRQLGFFLESIGLDGADGTIRSYDIGTVGAEPPFVEGAYSRGTHGEHTGRWLGGPTERSAMYVHPDAGEASEVRLTGRAISPGDITADVSFNGNQLDRIDFDRQGDAVYRASLVV